MDSRWLIFLPSHRQHHSTRLHCQFLDPGVNGAEEPFVGGEVELIGIAEARNALAWWLEAGVDVAVQEEARDWLKPVVPRPQVEAAPEPAPTPNIPRPTQETPPDLQEALSNTAPLPPASPTPTPTLP